MLESSTCISIHLACVNLKSLCLESADVMECLTQVVVFHMKIIYNSGLKWWTTFYFELWH